LHSQRKRHQSADFRRYSEKEIDFPQLRRNSTTDAYSSHYRCKEYNEARPKKESYLRKRKLCTDHDSDGRSRHVDNVKMRKVVDEKQNIKLAGSGHSNSVSKDVKGSGKVESEVKKERPFNSKVQGAVECSIVKTTATGIDHTDATSDLAEQRHSSLVKVADQTETVVRHEPGKGCNIEESRALLDVNEKICGVGSGEILDKGVAAYKAQSISSKKVSVLTSEKEPHSYQRELMSVVNTVTAGVNTKEKSYCKNSEAEHHPDSKPLVANNEEVESHEDSLGSGIQTRQGRKCVGITEGTKSSTTRKLNKETKESDHKLRKSNTLLTHNDDDANGCGNAEQSSVSCLKPNYDQKNAVQNHTGKGGGVAACKAKVTDVGKTEGQSLGESKPAGESRILGELANGEHSRYYPYIK
jgi:hypothetical protein